MIIFLRCQNACGSYASTVDRRLLVDLYKNYPYEDVSPKPDADINLRVNIKIYVVIVIKYLHPL